MIILATIPSGWPEPRSSKGSKPSSLIPGPGPSALANRRTRTLTSSGVCCLLAGVASFVYLGVIQ